MSIVDIHGNSVGSKIEQTAARLTTIELAIQRLQQNLANMAAQLHFETEVNIEAFKKLSVDILVIADEVAKKRQEVQPEDVKVEP